MSEITLHVGYVGKSRDGKRVEIVDYEPEKPWPYVDNEGKTYWENGGYMRHEPRQDDIIAPWVDEPPKPREFWVWRDCKGRVNHVFTTKTAKDDVHFLVGDEIIHVREVLQ